MLRFKHREEKCLQKATQFFFPLKRFSKTVFHRIYNASATMAIVVTYIFVISLDITIHFETQL